MEFESEKSGESDAESLDEPDADTIRKLEQAYHQLGKDNWKKVSNFILKHNQELK